MSRREILKYAGAGTAAAVLAHVSGSAGSSHLAHAAQACAAAADTQRSRRPNILFLMDDEHRGDCLGCDGNKAIKTPNLDRLASEGAMFSKAYCSLPSCTPARTSLLTGMSPWSHGLLGYGNMAERYPIEKPRLMREAGYHAMAIGKMHFNPPRNTHGYNRTILEESFLSMDKGGFQCDYAQYFESHAPGLDFKATGLGPNDRLAKPYPYRDELHPTYFTAQTAIDFLNAYNEDKPFFLKVSFQRPHAPYDPPQRFMDLYKDAQLPKADVGAWANEKFGGFGPPQKPSSPRGNLGDGVVRDMRQGYYGAISFVDEQIGRVLDALKSRGFLEDTLILFVSDHGEMAGDHHLWRKTYAYEGSARVPLIVRWGRNVLEAPRGQVLNQLVELRDVLPTFLDAAGIEAPPGVEGQSLLKLIRGQGQGWRTCLDMEHATCYWDQNVWTALTDGRHKYIYYAFDGEQQLFDLQDDPGELNDLSGDARCAGTLRDWRRRMYEHLAVRGEPWVKNGDLGLRTEPIIQGPNYPRATSSPGV